MLDNIYLLIILCCFIMMYPQYIIRTYFMDYVESVCDSLFLPTMIGILACFLVFCLFCIFKLV